MLFDFFFLFEAVASIFLNKCFIRVFYHFNRNRTLQFHFVAQEFEDPPDQSKLYEPLL